MSALDQGTRQGVRTIKRMRVILCAVVVLVTGATGTAVVIQPAKPFDPASDLLSICTSGVVPTATDTLGQPRHKFAVDVPLKTPLPGQSNAASHKVAKGDILQLRVTTSRGGFVAVHGILEEQRIQPGGTTVLKLRAKYSGRFPLHFHGDDGSHFEVAVFEVRPR